MKKLNIVIIFLSFLTNLAWAKSQPIDVISNEIDKKISWLITSHPDKKSVVEKFGPPQLEEKNKIYYALNNFKYSLCVQFDKNNVTYVNYKLPSVTNLTIKKFEKLIKAEEFSPYPDQGHEKGRFLSLMLKKEKLQLIFKNNSEKKLTRIIYDQK